ncbi:MAG: hypothetical protein AABZ74_03200 [Cyanobacteriota bacterium]
MLENEEDEAFFSLLTNISLTSESTLERLGSFLKVFVKKYFENQDFTPPENSLEIVTNSILKSEAILYTIYELEEKATTEEEKLELLYYKDIVLKTLVVVTNLDFFVSELKEHELYKDAYILREKVKSEFRIEASKIKQNPDTFSYTEIKTNIFRDVKPIQHRKESKEIKKDGLENKKTLLNLNLPDIKEEDLIVSVKDKNFSMMDRLKKAINTAKDKNDIKEEDKKETKKTRTSMGWQIDPSLFEEGIYSDK